jgi:hypothetical protein
MPCPYLLATRKLQVDVKQAARPLKIAVERPVFIDLQFPRTGTDLRLALLSAGNVFDFEFWEPDIESTILQRCRNLPRIHFGG